MVLFQVTGHLKPEFESPVFVSFGNVWFYCHQVPRLVFNASGIEIQVIVQIEATVQAKHVGADDGVK